MRVVFDTNVLVSMLLFKGRLSALFDLVASGELTLCFTPKTLNEFRFVLSRKKFATALSSVGLDVDLVLKALEPHSMIFSDPEGVIDLIQDDPSDNAFLGCALASSATYLVSGDRHVLAFSQFGKTSIISPKNFMEEIDV
ncbi:MAG: putative toxin-antitoxin system toxin component, PIN family [Candidatus Uhrbacteria bacterium]|nr:putative toxin-antitoxin system toxin component, PIN family [Candidatus Uhrbacteria bacterium]